MRAGFLVPNRTTYPLECDEDSSSSDGLVGKHFGQDTRVEEERPGKLSPSIPSLPEKGYPSVGNAAVVMGGFFGEPALDFCKMKTTYRLPYLDLAVSVERFLDEFSVFPICF